MDQRPIWKPVFIVIIIALCALMIKVNPPKPGMDLAGGFVLTYHVDVPADQNAADDNRACHPSNTDQAVAVQINQGRQKKNHGQQSQQCVYGKTPCHD